VVICCFNDRGSVRTDARALNIASCLVFALATLIPVSFIALTDDKLENLTAGITKKRAVLVMISCPLLMVFLTFPLSFYTYDFGSAASLMQVIIMPLLIPVTLSSWLLAFSAYVFRSHSGNKGSHQESPFSFRKILKDFLTVFAGVFAALLYLSSFNPYKISGDFVSTIILIPAGIAIYIQFKLLTEFGPGIVYSLLKIRENSSRVNMVIALVTVFSFLAQLHAASNTDLIDDPVEYSQFAGFVTTFGFSVLMAVVSKHTYMTKRGTYALLALGLLFPLAYLADWGIFDHIHHGLYHTMYYDFEPHWLRFPRIAGLMCVFVFSASLIQYIRFISYKRKIKRNNKLRNFN
jgi:hypothetical protein